MSPSSINILWIIFHYQWGSHILDHSLCSYCNIMKSYLYGVKQFSVMLKLDWSLAASEKVWKLMVNKALSGHTLVRMRR